MTLGLIKLAMGEQKKTDIVPVKLVLDVSYMPIEI